MNPLPLCIVGERKIVFISGIPDPTAAGDILLVENTESSTKTRGNITQTKYPAKFPKTYYDLYYRGAYAKTIIERLDGYFQKVTS